MDTEKKNRFFVDNVVFPLVDVKPGCRVPIFGQVKTKMGNLTLASEFLVKLPDGRLAMTLRVDGNKLLTTRWVAASQCELTSDDVRAIKLAANRQ